MNGKFDLMNQTTPSALAAPMAKRIFTITLLICLCSGLSKSQELFDLSSCIKAGLEQNFSILIARNQEKIASNNYTVGNAGYLPTLSGSGRYGGTINTTHQSFTDGTESEANGVNNTSGVVGVDLNMTIFNGFKVKATYQKLNEMKQLGILNTQLEMENLAAEIATYSSVDIWLNSTAVFVFSDKKVGVLKDGVYKIVQPKRILNAAGAREKFLRFPGNNLAGIYGAGAFQTLVNRDLVRPTQRLFIIGGGNVGLIAGYHSLQAGIDVVGLAEAMPVCGGYKVHSDKLKRFGVPIYTSHTILCANGDDTVESITIAELDKNFQPVKGTEKTFTCDTILIAVGLNPLSEFTLEAEAAGLPIDAAGDALEIAEASSAMFNGKIAGVKIASILKGEKKNPIPDDWFIKAEELKSAPGKTNNYNTPEKEEGVFPILHCLQEIPCNPCTTVCPTNSIHTEDGSLTAVPVYTGSCIGCGKCLLICPGLAITLVDYRKDKENPTISIVYEVSNYPVKVGDNKILNDINAKELGKYAITAVQDFPKQHTQIVKFKVPKAIAKKVAGFQIQDANVSAPLTKPVLLEKTADEAMVCLCERVTAGEVRALIRKGITDMNLIKSITRAGMGPCGSKTCEVLIKGLLREEGIPEKEIAPITKRPLFIEIPLEKFPNGSAK